ncbi:LacI family DNA-binding transcriptional regulator [Paenibacillus harenae]|uniref:LacI family DNA-binding transcriptional regulator n=1 Tax=Paenibacillus harenae TaxID=306543 RepID=UPI00278FE877|nr:LacI family DNA-binding transcriptional regulator [Paenibacillus harenae]MDQ0060570.1 LacI family transcriptional regulator [Paenibacillus harenae]
MPIRKKVTLQHIANQLQLTVHTVSKALRGLPGMSEETRQAVRQAAHELGYRTKEQERSMSLDGIPLFPSKPRRFILLLASGQDVALTIHQPLLEGMTSRLAEAGHKIELCFVPDGLNSDEHFSTWLLHHGIMYADGIFISPLIPASIERRLISLELPRIMLNFPPFGAKIDSIIWDVFNAMQQSVDYLVNRGHKKIMYIGDVKSRRGYKLRWMAFRDSMDDLGIEVRPDEHMLRSDDRLEEWKESWLDLVTRYEPTAFVCATEEALARTYLACNAAGKRLPLDYSIICLEPNVQGGMPDIARPVLPIRETGYRAGDRMIWRIANPLLPFEHIRLQGDFAPGNTIRDLRK